MNQNTDVPVLKTARLALKPLRGEDLRALYPGFSDPETMRFMPILPHQDEGETQVHLAGELNRRGAVIWGIWFNGGEKPIGHVHYLGETRVPGMGYMIERPYWGRGIATEACLAALAYGFDDLGYRQVELWIDDRNAASHRVAQKLGFRVRGRIAQKYPHEETYHFMMVYGMWKEEWRGQKKIDLPPRFFRSELVLLAPDIQAAAVFYQEKLGFNVDFLYGDPPTHAGVSRMDWTGSGVTIQITSARKDQPLNPASYLYIFVDENLDALHQAYKARGVEILSAPESYPWGLREFTIRDCNGYSLRFGSHIE